MTTTVCRLGARLRGADAVPVAPAAADLRAGDFAAVLLAGVGAAEALAGVLAGALTAVLAGVFADVFAAVLAGARVPAAFPAADGADLATVAAGSAFSRVPAARLPTALGLAAAFFSRTGFSPQISSRL